MRAELAPFAADGLLLLAGLGGLWACGVAPRRARALLPALGLAYLVGTALVSLALIALLAIGIPFTLVTFVLVALACVAAGVAVDRRRQRRAVPRGDDRSPHVPWRRVREWPADRWLVGGFVVLFGGYATIGLLAASVMPLDQWDAWTMWAVCTFSAARMICSNAADGAPAHTRSKRPCCSIANTPRQEVTIAVSATTDGLPVESGGIGGSASTAPDS